MADVRLVADGAHDRSPVAASGSAMKCSIR
jgi:hypothetical protein